MPSETKNTKGNLPACCSSLQIDKGVWQFFVETCNEFTETDLNSTVAFLINLNQAIAWAMQSLNKSIIKYCLLVEAV